ncbi:hypothetical protein LSAT2_005898 [Lamellibrachia satsuma]|nr:hypothetical protein LSAT2_005898 [Lamellibrachia satsuma]
MCSEGGLTVRGLDIDILSESAQTPSCSCKLTPAAKDGGQINVTLVILKSLDHGPYCHGMLRFEFSRHSSLQNRFTTKGDTFYCTGNEQAVGSAILTGHRYHMNIFLTQKKPYSTRVHIIVKATKFPVRVTCDNKDEPEPLNQLVEASSLSEIIGDRQKPKPQYNLGLAGGLSLGAALVLITAGVALAIVYQSRRLENDHGHTEILELVADQPHRGFTQ